MGMARGRAAMGVNDMLARCAARRAHALVAEVPGIGHCARRSNGG
ncbi:hypothetical protein I552_4012 [Mycobacterium xenopi 3993]|nr:hypothetical protein I552_4012 [Mycobacterium xenopi 3993]